MSEAARARTQVVVEGLLVGIALGALLGVLWWLVTPTITWRVVTGGAVVPAAIGHDDWFAADGWFLGLGVLLGLALTALLWRRGRRAPVALVAALAVGGGLLGVTGWAVGHTLGPDDPASLAGSSPVGTVLDGALDVGTPVVLLAPLLGALALLAVLLASVPTGPDSDPAASVPHPAPPSA